MTATTVAKARCTWISPCIEPGTHHVWRHAAYGQVVREVVCVLHLADARARGYREEQERLDVSVAELRVLADELAPGASVVVDLPAEAAAMLLARRGRP